MIYKKYKNVHFFCCSEGSILAGIILWGHTNLENLGVNKNLHCINWQSYKSNDNQLLKDMIIYVNLAKHKAHSCKFVSTLQ